MTMNPVVHFEMPADDRKRMSDFYSSAFGWKTNQLGAEMGDYVLVQTTETDEKGMPLKPARINGGFYQKKGMPIEQPCLVIGVENLEEAMKRVTESGGRMLGEPMEIPGYGMYATFLDTEGNRVSMMQPNEGM